jgi:hypothetical protein
VRFVPVGRRAADQRAEGGEPGVQRHPQEDADDTFPSEREAGGEREQRRDHGRRHAFEERHAPAALAEHDDEHADRERDEQDEARRHHSKELLCVVVPEGRTCDQSVHDSGEDRQREALETGGAPAFRALDEVVLGRRLFVRAKGICASVGHGRDDSAGCSRAATAESAATARFSRNP